MGRPSKLNDRQWSEIGRRLANGETATCLAKEFKVGRSTIVERFSGKVTEIKNAAAALATAELVVESMPVSDAASVRALADQLKGVQRDLLRSAQAGARTSAIMAGLAQRQAERLQRRADEEGVVEPEELRPMVAMIEAGNRASSVGVTLLSANREKGGDASSTLEDLVTGGR